ncbi:DEAD/DEAH box helicase family protein [Euryarchaeota archaeon]|nr:DEAD/DEAH box helicase family protein [Euryarchaeota archaeon]
MSRAVPTRYPLPKDENDYQVFLSLVEKEGIAKEEYIQRVMESTEFTHKYVEVITDNLIFYGFIQRKKGIYLATLHSSAYLDNKITFYELCRESLKKISYENTSTIDYILEIIYCLPNDKDEGITVPELLERLQENPYRGYEHAKRASYMVREILKLGVFSEYFKNSDKKYWYKEKAISKFRKELRRKSVNYSSEQLLNIVGDGHSVINDSFIVSIWKYQAYWNSRGTFKLRSRIRELKIELDKIHEDLHKRYVSRYARSQKGKSSWEMAKTYRKKLVSTLREKYDMSESSSLYSNLSRNTIFLLEKLVDSNYDYSQFQDSLAKSGNRKFDRSMLDKQAHGEGEFRFNSKIIPYEWQEKAAKAWELGTEHHAPFHGIVSAVTGSGKTVMAMLAVDRFLKKNSKGIVSVIVPTKVLMKQWAEEFSKILGLGSDQIGICGDGFKDSFSDGKRVIIYIINSAIRNNRLREDIATLESVIPHLLIADECHRYGGKQFAKAFNCRKNATLGLSATPPVEELSDSSNPDMNAVISALGKQFYKLSYKDARKQKLICSFSVKFVGVELEDNERAIYDNFSKKLSKALERIRMIYGHRIEAMSAVSLDQKLNMIISSDDSPDKSIYDYFEITRKRRDLIYDATNRISVYNELLKKGLNNNNKIMVFHEKIAQMEKIISPMQRRDDHGEGPPTPYQRKVYRNLEKWLDDKRFKPVIYHSKAFPSWNNMAMDLYRKDKVNVMYSVKALVEGVDVPAADLGIVRVSSSSIRQRIQTIGRVLRKGDYNKEAEIWIIFVENTVDKNMFKSYSWEKELGQSQIEYWHWDGEKFDKKAVKELPKVEDYEKDRPPIEVDVSELKIGDIYPGRLAGNQFGVDARSVPFKNTRNGRVPIRNKSIENAAKHLHKIKGGGKIYLTPQGNFITKVKRDLIFLGSTILEEFSKELEDSLNQKKKPRKSKSLEDLFS